MQRSMSEADSDYSQPNFNRSCNDKLQQDSLRSHTPPSIDPTTQKLSSGPPAVSAN